MPPGLHRAGCCRWQQEAAVGGSLAVNWPVLYDVHPLYPDLATSVLYADDNAQLRCSHDYTELDGMGYVESQVCTKSEVETDTFKTFAEDCGSSFTVGQTGTPYDCGEAYGMHRLLDITAGEALLSPDAINADTHALDNGSSYGPTLCPGFTTDASADPLVWEFLHGGDSLSGNPAGKWQVPYIEAADFDLRPSHDVHLQFRLDHPVDDYAALWIGGVCVRVWDWGGEYLNATCSADDHDYYTVTVAAGESLAVQVNLYDTFVMDRGASARLFIFPAGASAPNGWPGDFRLALWDYYG